MMCSMCGVQTAAGGVASSIWCCRFGVRCNVINVVQQVPGVEHHVPCFVGQVPGVLQQVPGVVELIPGVVHQIQSVVRLDLGMM